MRLSIPSVDDIKRYIKSELCKIEAAGYSVEQIHDCLEAYASKEARYYALIKDFSIQIHSAREVADYVHSVRFRTKDPYHLVDKLKRKCVDEKDIIKRRNITADTLFDAKEGVTDLGGVRVLHLRREEWIPLHKYFVEHPNMNWFSIVEKSAHVPPEIEDEYYKKGQFSRSEIQWDKDKRYTSLHYIFQSESGLHFECQVRTLFEEGWGEIDHQMNYPYKADSITRAFLSSLNSTMHTANEIASKLDKMSHIPLFVRWDTEQALERSADKVYCVTPDLQWVADNLDDFVTNVKNSAAKSYCYFILDSDDGAAKQNLSKVKGRLQSEELLDTKVFLTSVPKGKSVVPVLSDLLLLENASNPVEPGEPCNISVVGTPARIEVSRYERLDMLITDKQAITRMQAFFQDLAQPVAGT
jgi:GTP pyrophosphokinase